jgi:formylglycine-generating enzyme required for sulfatase activity
MADAAKWLLGRITDARRSWLSRKSSVALNLAPPVANCAGEGTSVWVPPPIRLVKAKKSPASLAVFCSLELADIPSGLFSMGADEGDDKSQDFERPVHGVVLSRPFRLAKYPVTQSLWEFCMGYNPSRFKGDLRPVENVTWKEANDFISRLSGEVGKAYRLPTEAEWEFAARAGRDWPYFFGPTPEELPQHAWFGYNSGSRSQNVGLKEPNPWGLYDMLGNVWEWVSDWFSDYEATTATNPKGPPEGASKVIRGGAWGSSPWNCRVNSRNVKNPDERSPLIGFRLALDWTSADDVAGRDDEESGLDGDGEEAIDEGFCMEEYYVDGDGDFGDDDSDV